MRLNCFQLVTLLLFVNHSYSQDLKPVRIYKQIWAGVNLSLDHFQNGDEIMEAKTKEEWRECFDKRVPAWCSYSNSKKNDSIYGKIYNFYAISDVRKVCPVGYKVPIPSDWMNLRNILNSVPNSNQYIIRSAKRMKSKTGWKDNGNGIDDVYLNGTPGGVRLMDGTFTGIKRQVAYWSFPEEWRERPMSHDAYRSLYFMLKFYEDDILESDNVEINGLYLRCVKE